MAHWIIEDRGFGGCWYRCSECGRTYNDLYHMDVSTDDCCPGCGAKINEDENVYLEASKRKEMAKAPEPHPGLKELNCWSVGGNKLNLDEGCSLSLYYEDEQGNTSDDVYIKLTPDRIGGLIGALREYVAKPKVTTTIMVTYTFTTLFGTGGQANYITQLDGDRDRLTSEDVLSIMDEIKKEGDYLDVVILNVMFLEG